jgi:hypothetical protein
MLCGTRKESVAMLKQFVVTPSAGKRLIAKALVRDEAVRGALRTGRLVIVAGTTNAYVADEVLRATGQAEAFSPRGFHRGWVLPPGLDAASVQADLPGDVILVRGVWERGRTIYDFADLGEGDVILKGANALDVRRRRAAVLIGHPKGGTAAVAAEAVIGRRATLIVPVGLEKRVEGDLDELALLANAPPAEGPRLHVLPGRAFCELDAIEALTGAKACMLSAGGVYGAEGSVWLGVAGSREQVLAAEELLRSVQAEPPTKA